MTNRAEEMELPEARYEGTWTRLNCEVCGEIFEVEDDVSNGERVECDACGQVLEVAGR